MVETQITDIAELAAVDRPVAVYASPLARVRESAGIMAHCLGLDVGVEADLAEFDSGSAYLRFEGGTEVWERYHAGDLTPWGPPLYEDRWDIPQLQVAYCVLSTNVARLPCRPIVLGYSIQL